MLPLTRYTDLIGHDPDENSWMHMAPVRILSFDIECMVRDNQMCDPEVDSVLQIATVVKIHGKRMYGNITCHLSRAF